MDEKEKKEVITPIESTVVKLNFPVKHPDGSIVDEIILRRLKAKDLKAVNFQQGGEVGAMLKLIALMAALPERVLDELDAADALNVCKEAAPFLDGGTGLMPFP